MTTTKKSNKEFSVTVNLIIFLTLICLVGITRLLIVHISDKNTFENVSIIAEINYDSNMDLDKTLSKVENTMEKHYDIDIYYGDMIQEIATIVQANVLQDKITTLSIMQNLNNEFQKYPEGLIKEIQDKGYKVSVYIVDSFNNGNVALANRTSNGYFNIFLSDASDFAKAFHHELYHILEYYIKLEYDIELAYINWDKYNPSDFKYEQDVTKLTYNNVYGLDSQRELCFVSLYSKFSESEDRAEVFSSMMVSNENYKKNYKASNILNKMNNITQVLDDVFASIKSNMYWERYKNI
ncbi:MAG: hypothetical protein IKV94_05980 [Clostridia bacterium]|nr:hypothetical protein [Clostridia bacterium]